MSRTAFATLAVAALALAAAGSAVAADRPHDRAGPIGVGGVGASQSGDPRPRRRGPSRRQGRPGRRERRRRRAGAGRRGRARLDRLRLDGRRDRSDRRDRGRRACGSARSCRRSRPPGGPRDRVARCVALPGGRPTGVARQRPTLSAIHSRAWPTRTPSASRAPSRSAPTRSSSASRARPGPGGQHANTSETRVEALFDVEASPSLTDRQKQRVVAKAAAPSSARWPRTSGARRGTASSRRAARGQAPRTPCTSSGAGSRRGRRPPRASAGSRRSAAAPR